MCVCVCMYVGMYACTMCMYVYMYVRMCMYVCSICMYYVFYIHLFTQHAPLQCGNTTR
jgi:hypothetical protein